MRKLVYIALSILALSCNKETEPQFTASSEEILVEQLKAFPQLDRFREAMEACEVKMNANYQNLSIFAPSNEELNRLLNEFEVADFTSMKSQMGTKYYRAWLASHFVPSAAKVENLRTSYIPTLAMNAEQKAIHHHFVREKSIVEINGQRLSILSKDHSLAAGYVHIINNSLRPATLFKLVNSNDHNFSILQQALQGPAKSIASQLNSDSDNLTFFAPNDYAFEQYFRDKNCSDLNDYLQKYGANQLVELLKGHIIKTAYDLQDLDGTRIETLLNGSFMDFQVINGNIEIKRTGNLAMGPFPKATIHSGNIYGFNGSLHLLNEVLKLN